MSVRKQFASGVAATSMVVLTALGILYSAGWTVLRKGDEIAHATEILTDAGYVVVASETPVLEADGWTCDPPDTGSAPVANIVQVQFEMPGDVWEWQIAVNEYPYRTRVVSLDAQGRVGLFSTPGHSDSSETFFPVGRVLTFPDDPWLAPFVIEPCGSVIGAVGGE